MQTPVLETLGWLVAAYALGSVPTAVWVGRAWHGQDIRTLGSGNAGSTNTYRTFGAKAGALVQVIDIAKGCLAAGLPLLAGAAVELAYGCALVAVLGHIYPVWAGFRGGKGMNTLLGAFVVLDPLASGLAVGAFVLCLYLSSMVSLSSMVAVATLPLVVWGRGQVGGEAPSPVVGLLAVVFPVLIVYTHRSNLGRIRTGTERRVRFGLNRPPKQASTAE